VASRIAAQRRRRSAGQAPRHAGSFDGRWVVVANEGLPDAFVPLALLGRFTEPVGDVVRNGRLRQPSKGAQLPGTAADRAVTLRVEPLTPELWPDLEALFGSSGAYAHCWCTWWRQSGADFDAGCRRGGSANRELLRRLTADGRIPGLIAYRDAEPIGWVSVAPRAEFGRILRSPTLKPHPAEHRGEDEATWAIVCFWIPRAHRGQGVATALLRAAVERARTAGARRVEAYPIPTDGGRRDSSGLFTGTLGMFEKAGFTVARQRKPTRPVVELRLG
jgi:GNAT superfamily N-acetyltransferase